MDEEEFHRLLDLFPKVRSRNYHGESEKSRPSNLNSANDELIEWKDAWSNVDKNESKNKGIDYEDPFWNKLRLAAERKVGAAEADRFCKAFQTVHKKLVYEDLSLDSAQRFLKSSSYSQ